MQTQSRDGYVFVVLVFIRFAVFEFNFFLSKIMCFVIQQYFIIQHVKEYKKENFLAHKKHWNATVGAAAFTAGNRDDRETVKSAIRRKLTTRKNVDHLYRKKNLLNKRAFEWYVKPFFFVARVFHFFCRQSDSFDHLTVCVSVGGYNLWTSWTFV